MIAVRDEGRILGEDELRACIYLAPPVYQKVWREFQPGGEADGPPIAMGGQFVEVDFEEAVDMVIERAPALRTGMGAGAASPSGATASSSLGATPNAPAMGDGVGAVDAGRF